MVDRLDGSCRWFKVGLELFCTAGSPLVRELRRRGFNIFLDLKLHDIPNTVAAAVRSLSQLDVQLLTVHASGGGSMLRAAQQEANKAGGPALLGVTVLTSMDGSEMREIGVMVDAEQQVLRLARVAARAHLAGVVCSPLEVVSVRAELGQKAMLITPGVRPETSTLGVDDQRRTATAREAIQRGASMLVVGRPITRAADPAKAAAAVLEEIASAGD